VTVVLVLLLVLVLERPLHRQVRSPPLQAPGSMSAMMQGEVIGTEGAADAAAAAACAALRQQAPIPVDRQTPLGGATVAVPSGRAVWRLCDAIVRAPAAAGGTLFIESAAVRVEEGVNQTVAIDVVAFHEGREYAAEAACHGAQTGVTDARFWLTSSGGGRVPCRAVRTEMPDVMLLTCVDTDHHLAIPPAYPNAPPWELELRWDYGGGDSGGGGGDDTIYDARIRMCAAGVPSMYTCTESTAPPRRVPRLGICVSSLSNPHGTLVPKLVVDFLEYYRLLGVHHVTIHMRPDAMAAVGTALAAAYAADAPHFMFEAVSSGYVTADPANMDKWAYYDQAAILNSCLGHLRGAVEWLGLFDIDEWLVVGNGTAAEPLAATLTQWGCSGALTAGGAPRVHATACNDTPLVPPVPAARLSCLHMLRDFMEEPFVPGGAYPGGATALEYFAHAIKPAPIASYPKLWCDPTALAATWVHHAVDVPGARAVQVPPNATTFRHFSSYFNTRAQPGKYPRPVVDAAFARRLAAASAARLAHPAFAATTVTPAVTPAAGMP